MKHDWVLNEYGRIDSWRMDIEYHNGPECIRCGLIACQHCEPGIFDEECPSGQLDFTLDFGGYR